MSDVKKVAVVGLGIGRSHIVEGYLPHPDRFEVAVLCDLNEERLNAVGDEFGIDEPHQAISTKCWHAAISTSSISARRPARISS